MSVSVIYVPYFGWGLLIISLIALFKIFQNAYRVKFSEDKAIFTFRLLGSLGLLLTSIFAILNNLTTAKVFMGITLAFAIIYWIIMGVKSKPVKK